MANRVSITIDGLSIFTAPGRNLVDVAKENGIFIPSLCYHPRNEVPPGTCRGCMVRVNGKTGPACLEKTRADMEVEVNTADLKDMRKAVVEMMFAEGNHFCPSCEKSGDCDLQHIGYEMEMTHTRFPHLFKDRRIDFGPERMVMDYDRCIKCHRCVDEIHTDEGKKVFSYINRGNETKVEIDYNAEAALSEEQALNAMHICPTGAIIIRGVNFPKPFGQRKYDFTSVQQDYGKKPLRHHPVQKEKKIIATVSLAGCFGCHMSILDIDAGLLDVIELVEFNKSPLTDIKTFNGRCHLGIVEGGCCNAENIEVLREFREKCDILVALGECAIWGGLPAMRNTVPLSECLEEAYLNSFTNLPAESTIPYHTDLPKLLDKVYPCSEIVKIDYHIPGCPPSAEHIWKMVKNALWGEEYLIPYAEFKYD